MQTDEEYNQAYKAGWDGAMVKAAVDIRHMETPSDSDTDWVSVPLRDGNSRAVIGHIHLDRSSGMYQGTIQDPELFKMLTGQFGAGLRGISFDSFHNKENI